MPQLQCEEIRFPSADGVHTVAASMYTMPGVPVRAVLQLSHGMCEYVQRYRPMAQWYAQRGIALAGNDHLGHGGSIRTKEDYGYFGEPDGNRAVLEDLHAVTTLTKQLYPGVPYFLLGHSMGSFYARQYLCEWGDELDGAIIMGTGYQPKALVQLARTICRVLAVFHGWHYRSKLVARLSLLGDKQRFTLLCPPTGGWRAAPPTTGSTVTRWRWTATAPTSVVPLSLP